MDFELTERQKEFKKEIIEFCFEPENQRMLQDLLGKGGFYNAHSWELFRKMAEMGWISLNWPREYGGLGYTPGEMSVFHETMSYYRMPMTGLILTSLIGNIIAYFGSDELKREFLPRAAIGDLLFCLLYTEPDAGSDLAAVNAMAEEDGDFFIINGTKIFTTLGHEAHYGLMAARTDTEVPRTKGISMFLVPLDAEGVTVNPIYTMGGGRVSEEVFSNVRIPGRYMIGRKNEGWMVLSTALGLERGSLAGVIAQGKRYFGELLAEIRKRRLDSNPVVQQQIAQIEIELEIADLMNWNLISLISHGNLPIAEVAMAKLFISESMKQLSNVSMNILGFPALLKRDSECSPLGGIAEYFYQVATMITVGGGSSEILQRIIARVGLGLPEEGFRGKG